MEGVTGNEAPRCYSMSATNGAALATRIWGRSKRRGQHRRREKPKKGLLLVCCCEGAEMRKMRKGNGERLLGRRGEA